MMGAEAIDALSDEWLAAVATASAPRAGTGRSGRVAITIGKSKRAVLDIVDGEVKAVDEAIDDEPAVTVPVTAKQLVAVIDGDESLAQAFMRGDVKPVGATGPLLAVIELFEDDDFRQRLAALVG
ncbi:MAG: SCP2 sterol-binding domain-containing protein [Acidimicrobiales bacterium]